MKLYNITDQWTSQLDQYKLVNAGFEIDGKVLAPGTSMEVPDELKPALAHFFRVGALVEKLPEAYEKRLREEPTIPDRPRKVEKPVEKAPDKPVDKKPV